MVGGEERCGRRGRGGGMTKGDSCDTNPIHPLAHIHPRASSSNQSVQSFVHFLVARLPQGHISCCSLETGHQLL